VVEVEAAVRGNGSAATTPAAVASGDGADEFIGVGEERLAMVSERPMTWKKGCQKQHDGVHPEVGKEEGCGDL
jgi:hypothetical protein